MRIFQGGFRGRRISSVKDWWSRNPMFPRRSGSVAAFPGPIVATRSSGHAANATSDGSVQENTFRTRCTVTRNAASIAVRVGNWDSYTILNGALNPALNTITVKVGVEYGGVVYPMAFSGSSSKALAAGASATTDALALAVVAGQDLLVRVYVSVATLGEVWPLGWVGFLSGEGVSSGDHAHDSGGSFSAAYMYGPVCVVGDTATSEPTVAIVGDSIAFGVGDGYNAPGNNKPGWVLRALNDGFGYAYTCAGGTQAVQVAASANRVYIATLWPCCSSAVEAYGRNDLTSAGRTAAEILTDRQAIWSVLLAAGVDKIFAATITPQTSSTDAWVTTVNQTVGNATFEARRVTFNDDLRANAVSYGVTLLDVADAVESARNSGLWKVAGGAHTDDGLHPNAVGHAAMAATLNTGDLV